MMFYVKRDNRKIYSPEKRRVQFQFRNGLNNAPYILPVTKMEKSDAISEAVDVESLVLIHSPAKFGKACCAKTCIAITITAIISPVAICDLYYAATDNTCTHQNTHGLTITVHSYLLASGIIATVIIVATNIGILVMTPANSGFYTDQNGDATISIQSKICDFVGRTFNIAWLILGCVLFWAYTDISQCSDTVRDYLFARFIIGLLCSIASLTNSSNK